MTTMTNPSTGYAGDYPPPARRLRRSATDRIVSGVSGGLGQYFGVDPVLFRVLFAVLSFFAGVGLLAYAVAWLLIPEPAADTSLLDRSLHELRVRRVPPWLVVLGGAVLVWVIWFSWWAPGTLPAVLLLAVVTLVLMYRLAKRPVPPVSAGPPPAWTPPPPGSRQWSMASTGPAPEATSPETGPPAESGLAPEQSEAEAGAGDSFPGSATESAPPWPPQSGWPAAEPGQPAGPTRLIPPLNDTRRSMQEWLAEASEAHRQRVRRRRPIKIGVLLALIAGWGFVGLLDAFNRVPFPAYIWTGLAIFGAGLIVSVISRRLTLSLLFPLLVLAVVAVGLGGTRASLSDGSGNIGWRPASTDQLSTYRQFAGRSTLDLTGLRPATAPAEARITQAAGEVVIRIPRELNVTVIADVHFGDIQDGQSKAIGQYQSGMNVHLELDPPTAASGEPITVHVSLTNGHVEVDRS